MKIRTKKITFVTICCVLCMFILSTCCVFPCAAVFALPEKENNFELQAKSGFLIDYHSGTVLYEQNSQQKLQVASIVKLMTLLLTFEALDKGEITLEGTAVASRHAASMGGSQMFLDADSEYVIDELIKSVVMASANDCAVVLAEKLAGSETDFVSLMNSRAQELGMHNTRYANATGLPGSEQYSTAEDTAKLLREVIKHPVYFKYSTQWMDEFTHPSGRKTERVNTNKLSRYFDGCDAGKTGSTDEAGFCLAATAKRGDMRLISVVLGAKTGTERFNASSKLLNFGFTNYENQTVVRADEVLGEIVTLKSKTKTAHVYAAESFHVISKKGKKVQLESVLEFPEKISAPIQKNSKIGTIKILKNGIVEKEIELVLHEDIETIKFTESFKDVISKWNQK